MDNFIDHDSLHRVEPTAKQQSEAIAKAESDAAAMVKGQIDQNELRENSPSESDIGSNVENDGSHDKNQNPKSQDKENDEEKKPDTTRENFMGGQLFDTDA